MIHFFEKFRIPTILGLGIILIGVFAGTFLVLREQILESEASPNVLPIQDTITFTNIYDTQATVSWQSENPAASFVSFGQNNPQEKTSLDNRDKTSPKSHLFHYVTLTNLKPQTQYQLKIITGRKQSEVLKFKTASPSASKNNFGPIIGSVLEDDKPLVEGVAYLSIANASVQSSLIKNMSSFLIPLTEIRKDDLSDIFSLTSETIAKLTIIGKSNQATALFKLDRDGVTLPVLKLGQNLDLTNSQIAPEEITPSVSDLKIFDLNSDGQINAIDNAILLRNFGKNPKEKKADLNSDGVVDEKDLRQMAEKINKPIIP